MLLSCVCCLHPLRAPGASGWSPSYWPPCLRVGLTLFHPAQPLFRAFAHAALSVLLGPPGQPAPSPHVALPWAQLLALAGHVHTSACLYASSVTWLEQQRVSPPTAEAERAVPLYPAQHLHVTGAARTCGEQAWGPARSHPLLSPTHGVVTSHLGSGCGAGLGAPLAPQHALFLCEALPRLTPSLEWVTAK